MSTWRVGTVLLISALVFCPVQVLDAVGKEPLTIGAVFSITGKAKSLGKPESNTVLMLTQAVNKAGGINGYPLKVVIKNDETLKTAAKGMFDTLIREDRVLAIIGPSTSGISLAVKPIVERAKVPMVSCAAAEAIVSPPESSRYTFKTPQRDSHVVMRILERIKYMGIGKIAILSETTGFGEQGRKQLKNHAPQMGIEIVADETFNTRAVDMTPQLKKIQACGAGAVVNWSVVPTQTIVPRNMKQLGMDIPLFHSHGMGNPKFIKTAGEACDGVMFPAGRLLVATQLPMDHFQREILMKYKRDYEKEFGTCSTFGGHAYDAFWIVVNAMKAKRITPSMDLAQARDLTRDGIEETKGWIGTGGVFNMSASDHCGLDKNNSLEMLVVGGGTLKPLLGKKLKVGRQDTGLDVSNSGNR